VHDSVIVIRDVCDVQALQRLCTDDDCGFRIPGGLRIQSDTDGVMLPAGIYYRDPRRLRDVDDDLPLRGEYDLVVTGL